MSWGVVKPNDEDLGMKKTHFEPKHAHLPIQGFLVSLVSADRAALLLPPTPPQAPPQPSPAPFSSQYLTRARVNGAGGIEALLRQRKGKPNGGSMVYYYSCSVLDFVTVPVHL